MNIQPIGYQEQPTNLFKEKYTMNKIFNWKTTTIGILIFIYKTLEGYSIVPANLLGVDVINALTALVGIFAADASQVKPY